MPDEDGILFNTVEEAESAIFNLLMDYAQRGYTVTRTEFLVDGQRLYSVVDEARRPFGVYSIYVPKQ